LADDSDQDRLAVQRSAAGPPFARALVVDDEERLRRAVAEALDGWASEVRTAGSIAQALALFEEWQPELLVLDFRLPDGDARGLLREIARGPRVPSTIAMSAFAKPEHSFELAQLGVRAYLEKPFTAKGLESALGQALSPPDLTPQLREAVGRSGLQEVEESVRRTMVAEALSRAHGSRRMAARLLGVSRQFVQHVLRKLTP
jgi:two-component system, response regulator RegA